MTLISHPPVDLAFPTFGMAMEKTTPCLEPSKIPWLIDCEKGDYITWFTGDYDGPHRETVFNQLVFHEGYF
jgi:hypothetical protein